MTNFYYEDLTYKVNNISSVTFMLKTVSDGLTLNLSDIVLVSENGDIDIIDYDAENEEVPLGTNLVSKKLIFTTLITKDIEEALPIKVEFLLNGVVVQIHPEEEEENETRKHKISLIIKFVI